MCNIQKGVTHTSIHVKGTVWGGEWIWMWNNGVTEGDRRAQREAKGVAGRGTDKYLAISLCAPWREHKHTGRLLVSNPRPSE